MLWVEGRPQGGRPLSSRSLQLEVLARPPVVTSTPAPKAEPTIIPAARNEPIGLKASDFLPVSRAPPKGGWKPCGEGRTLLPASGCLSHQAVKIPQQAELVDEDAMSQIRKGHDTMCVVLTSRHKNLDTVRAVWTTGDIKAGTAPAWGSGLNRRQAARGRAGGEAAPSLPPRHPVADFIFVSSVVVITGCWALSSYLWACLTLIILGVVLLTPHEPCHHTTPRRGRTVAHSPL